MNRFWLYVSRSSTTPDAIKEIVLTSKPRNQLLAVTGALIFASGCFAQYIEGPKAAMDQLKSSILRDTRHYSITTLREGCVDKRRFSGWSLAYAGPSQYIGRELEILVNNEQGVGASGIERLLWIMEEFAS